MEQQVLELLKASQLPAAQPRTAAEAQLKELYANQAFPTALVTIGAHKEISVNDRLAALLSLKCFVNTAWSPSLEDYEGHVLLSNETKDSVRTHLLSIVYDDNVDSKITSSTAATVARIAKVDFPEDWPGLLESLLSQVPQSNDDQIQAVLVVLGELISDGLDEEQFYRYTHVLVDCLRSIAIDVRRKLVVRAHAVNIFRGCLDFVENIKDKEEADIVRFAKGICDSWSPFFLDVVKEPMPSLPSEEEEAGSSNQGINTPWRGVIALKTQVTLTLARIQAIFPDLMPAQEFFNACWDSIQAHATPYYASYVDGERQGGLINQYQLQYTFDFLVIEEIDFLQALLEAPLVKQQLDGMALAAGDTVTNWITSVLGTLVNFSSITKEAEEMWSFDFNVFLSEETFAETNNSPRSVCAGWRQKEAALFTLQQVAEEFENESRIADPAAVVMCVDYTRQAMSADNEFLRARGHITMAAIMVAWMDGPGADHDTVLGYAQQSLIAMDNDASDVVKTACIRIMRDYLTTLPSPRGTELQARVVESIAKFLDKQELADMDENIDLVDVVLQTLRDTIMANPLTCLEHTALDVLLTMVKYGAARDNHSGILIDEAFESAAEAMASQGAEAYARLCQKIIPSLMAAFDVEDPNTKEKTALTDVAASILKILAESAIEPLPQGFIAAAMPRLCRLIFSDVDFYLRQSATLTIKHMLTNDKDQVFTWVDPELQKNGLEMCFLVIGHLLGPQVDDASASEVGELAVSIVDQAGTAVLGDSMRDLLRILAERLHTAEHLGLIQSLTLVFARLSLLSVTDVLDFLSSLPIDTTTALTIVLQKWLENSSHYVGFDAIRQNVSALVAVYRANDPRVEAVECNGDLIPDTSSRIKTRSMAKSQPIRHTRIPAPLKLIKILVAELLPYGDPSTALKPLKSPGLGGPAARVPSSEGSWESDDEDGASRGGFSSNKAADDATQKFLVDFFRAEGAEPRFQALYAQLTDEERKRCIDAVEGWGKMESQRGMMLGQ